MKYIITKTFGVVIFSEGYSHKEIAKKINEDLMSAGMIGSSFNTYGKSVSLGIESDPRDGEIIKRQFQIE